MDIGIAQEKNPPKETLRKKFSSQSGSEKKIVVPEVAPSATVNILLIKVENSGFTVEPTWTVGDRCDVNKHKTAFQATIIPNNASTLIFSIQGNPNGATIDPNSGVITPGTGVGTSGTITARAAATNFPNCFTEKSLLIRARPFALISSTASPANMSNAYGGGWTHTFSSTYGSLNGVQISEKVQTLPPDPFGLNYNVQPGGQNVWTLSGSGIMTTPDYYIVGIGFINALLFLPSPPNAGLPQSTNLHQWYYWWCPLDNIWNPFTGPANIDVMLSQQGNNLAVTTSAYGQSITDTYVGPAVLNNFILNPSQIPANGSSTSQASVTILPTGRSVIWSISGSSLGCTINPNSGLVTAGTQTGTITIRATDATYPNNWTEGPLLLTQP